MITIDKIRNGDQAEEVREKINNNFEKLSKNSGSDIMALSTEERLAMSNEYLRDGLIVFDITLQTWFKRTGNEWVLYTFYPRYRRKFTLQDWTDSLSLYIPYATHGTNADSVNVYMLHNNNYSSVIVDIEVNNNYDVTLYSDFAFSGEVVIV